MDISDENIEDISSQFEDMDIDYLEVDDPVSLKERSDKMDEKVKELQDKNEGEEIEYFNKRRNTMMKKKLEGEKKSIERKKETKKRKQENKSVTRKNRRTKDTTSKVAIEKVPNIADVPDNVKHLVNIKDVLYTVPGDGACLPNTASAFYFHDEIFVPKLRSNMNLFMANHWSKRYQYLTSCSEKHPFVRKVRGGKVSFTDPKKLIAYLASSEKQVQTSVQTLGRCQIVLAVIIYLFKQKVFMNK